MTAGTSLSEAALGCPSLRQAAVCYPSLSEAAVVITSLSEAGASTEHRRACSRRSAPAPSTGIPSAQHQRPAPRCWHPVSNTRTASAHHAHARRWRPLSPPPALSAPSAGTVSPPRAQQAHSAQHHARSQLTAPTTSARRRRSAGDRVPVPALVPGGGAGRWCWALAVRWRRGFFCYPNSDARPCSSYYFK